MKSFSTIIVSAAATLMLSYAALAQQANTGTVTRVDEAKGTVTISQVEGTSASNTGSAPQEYKVQDGLVFNAVKDGDRVSFTTENKDGGKTITKLQKQ